MCWARATFYHPFTAIDLVVTFVIDLVVTFVLLSHVRFSKLKNFSDHWEIYICVYMLRKELCFVLFCLV